MLSIRSLLKDSQTPRPPPPVIQLAVGQEAQTGVWRCLAFSCIASSIDCYAYAGDEGMGMAEQIDYREYAGDEGMAKQIDRHTYTGDEGMAKQIDCHTYAGDEGIAKQIDCRAYA